MERALATNTPRWILLATLLLTPACAPRASSPRAPDEGGGLGGWLGDTAHRLAETTADAAGDAAQTAGDVADDVASVTSDAAYAGARITDDVAGAAEGVTEADEVELELVVE